MKDIPLAKDIDAKTPIEIQTETGIVRMFPVRFIRDDANQKGFVSIQGVCHTNVELLKQCFVLFKGSKIEGKFSKVTPAHYLWQATFEMIVSLPEYWVEA